MKTILEELFSGNLDPHTKYFVKNLEYGKLVKIISDNEEKLLDILADEEKAILLAFSNAQLDINSITARENFVSGFQLGALIMLEVLASKKEFTFEPQNTEDKPCR